MQLQHLTKDHYMYTTVGVWAFMAHKECIAMATGTDTQVLHSYMYLIGNMLSISQAKVALCAPYDPKLYMKDGWLWVKIRCNLIQTLINLQQIVHDRRERELPVL